MRSRLTSLVLVLALLGAGLAGLTGCAPAASVTSAKPGTVWTPSASGLPTLYVFGDPS